MIRLGVIAIAVALAGPALARDWTLDRSASSITFETDAFGRDVSGSFGTFDAIIFLNPDDLTTARVEAWVDVGTVVTGTLESEDALRGESGFDAFRFARARFISRTVREADTCNTSGARCLVAQGELSIRNVTQRAELPFTLSIDGDHAVADGVMRIRRSDFNVGTVEWGLAGRITEVNLHIEADAAAN